MGEHRRFSLSPIPRHDDYGYILGLAITEELLEAGIEFDICRLFSKSRRENCDKREDVLSLSTCLHSSNVCPFLLTLSNISRKASLHEREWDAGNARRLHTGMRRDRRGYPDYPHASFPSHSRENPSCLSVRSNQKNQAAENDDSELTIVRIICSNSTIPVKMQRSEGSRGAMVAGLVRCMEVMNPYQSVKTTNFLFSWTGGYGRVLSGAVSACVMTSSFLHNSKRFRTVWFMPFVLTVACLWGFETNDSEQELRPGDDYLRFGSYLM
jgi:hypothetical protein